MESEQSAKRDCRIRIERIPADLHGRLSRFCSTHRYSKMNDALMYCASIGLSVLEAADVVVVKIGNQGLPRG
jgi:hypothetical protein